MSKLRGGIDEVFLLWYLICGFLALLFLFYFNRLIASIASFAIRSYTWHYYRVHIDIQALQVSLLAGRVFLKKVHYYGRNETIIVQDGYITWRYWLRRIEESDIDDSNASSSRENDGSSGKKRTVTDTDQEAAGGNAIRKDLPCRVLVKARGVQWFIYNRSPAYDAILERLNGGSSFETGSSPAQNPGSLDEQDESKSSNNLADNGGPAGREESNKSNSNDDRDYEKFGYNPTRQSTEDSTTENEGRNASLPSLLGILPIKIECSKGAIVMGNQSTRSILTATFETASGIITARAARPLDQYKQIFDFAFMHPIIQFKHNKEYQCTQIEKGRKQHSETNSHIKQTPRWYEKLKVSQRIKRTLARMQALVPFHQHLGSVESFSHARQKTNGTPELTRDESASYGPQRWMGLTRYLDDNDASIEQERWKSIEYAQYPTIVDAPSITMNFYWDVPGEVQIPTDNSYERSLPYKNDINGDEPPDWGIDLRVKGGTVNYGPWADRQRVDLQTVFFPTLYMDALVGKRLNIGQTRVSTEMKMTIIFEELTTLRIPTREDSKDWKFKGHVPTSNEKDTKTKKAKSSRKGHKAKRADDDPESRPFGWLDLVILPDSTVSFAMDLVAKHEGYKNSVILDFKGIELSSSVNHAILLKSQSQVISCDLNYPLAWNALRCWNIDIQAESTELYLLRDHVFLMTDLVSDWTSGPPPEFHTFVPFIYTVALRFKNSSFYLNANDSNVIDNPANPDDNTFVVIRGQELVADLSIPSENYRPVKNTVSIDIQARDASFELTTPPWNTQHAFLTTSQVAALKDLQITGSYNFHASSSPTLTDVFQLDVQARSMKAVLYGFLIRYLMKIKDNYFGDDVHFRTVEEFQHMITTPVDNTSKNEQRNRPNNDLDVIIGISVSNSFALLPSQLYSASEGIILEIPSLGADLRVTNYYMDLAIISSPLGLSQVSRDRKSLFDFGSGSAIQISVNSVQICGHRLFGLPPTEPTYVCNWDFDVGRIEGDCSIEFSRNLAQAISCFGLTFPDAENVVTSVNTSVIHDVTFLRARLKPLNVGLRIEQTALLFRSEDISMNFNDWAGTRFSDHVSAYLPNLNLSLVETNGVFSGDDVKSGRAKAYACLQTTIDMRSVARKPDFEEDREQQQHHIALHDVRTHRTPWLISPNPHVHTQKTSVAPGKVRPPAMCYPSMPVPISMTDTLGSRKTSLSSGRTRTTGPYHGAQRKSSFLSASSVKMGNERAGRAATSRSARERSGATVHGNGNATVDQVYLTSSSARAAALDSREIEAASTSSANLQQVSSHSGFAFTSPYKKPHFPVLALIPDTEHVPQISHNLASENVEAETFPQDDVNDELHPGASHSSLMIIFSKGISCYCTPKALFLATKLQEGFQVREPEALLDRLQIDTMSQLLRANAKRKNGSSVRDIRIRLPFIGLRFINQANALAGISNRHESYELSIEDLTATLRFSDLISQEIALNLDHQMSAHVKFTRLECSAREYTEGHNSNQAVIGLTLLQPVFWMNKSTALSANFHFKDLEVASASRKVDYISSLVRQTLLLGEALSSRFMRAASSQRSRLALLVLLLTKEGEEIPDPSFLSGASYVLRSAKNHLRATDSWKMISRLRHALKELPIQVREGIRHQCAERFVSCPPDGSSYVVKTFDHWRTWDLAHVQSSILMQKTFGDMLLSPAERFSKVVPSKASLRAGRICVLIDPGPHQNEIVVSRAMINTALFQAKASSPASSETEASRSMDSTIEVYSAQVALRLNWTLCELIESIVRTIQDAAEPDSPEVQYQAHTPATVTPTERTNWHIIACIDMAIVNVDTLALKVISLSQGLRSSLVFMGKSNADNNGLVSLAVCADATTSEIRNLTKALTLYKLRRPSVVGSRDHSVDGGLTKPWRFVGSEQELSFEVLANPLEVLEAADNFIQNEVVVIFSWLQSIQSRAPQQSHPRDPPVVHPALPAAHVTLFLNAYSIGLTVLPTLIYQIHGSGVRTSVKSRIRGDFRVDLDLDIRDHSHVFSGGLEADAKEISTLHIPPINGRLALDLAPKQNSVLLRALAEPIMFDASAIHSMITAINTPEIVSIVKNASDQITLIQDHAPQAPRSGSLNSAQNQNVGSPPQPVLYDAFVTLAGVAIHASAPDAGSKDSAARLEFNMGRVQLKAANNDSGRLDTLRHPELEARLDSIRLRLLRSKTGLLIPCGEVALALVLYRTSKANELGNMVPSYQIKISNTKANIYTETASVIVSIAGHLQNTLKTIEVSEEVKSLGRLGYARLRNDAGVSTKPKATKSDRDPISEALMNAMYSLELTDIQLVWNVEVSASASPTRTAEDLVLSFSKINLATKRENAAKLIIQDLQLQMVPRSMAPTTRSANSALLPEVVFNVAYFSTPNDRRFAFQAKGKALDLRLTSLFIFPASVIRRSIAVATEQVRAATKSWYAATPVTTSKKRMNPLGSKKLGSVLVDADFAGAVVYVQGRNASDPQSVVMNTLRSGKLPQHGRYNQFTPDDTTTHATLRAPGFAFKAEYKSIDVAEPHLNAELKVDASSNTLYPTVVPLIMEISSSVKEMVGKSDEPGDVQHLKEPKLSQTKFFEDEPLKNTDPAAIFGDVRLNLGLRICRQEFSLSCQPIARVAATACFDDIYITVNTVRSDQHGKFFSISATISNLKVTVQHVYSRESTGGFKVNSIVLSLMNSRHVSKTNGISAILKLSPTKIQINAKQSQDFLLFREIWIPVDIRQSSTAVELTPSTEPQAFIVQRYQQVAAAGAFPWNATVSVDELDVQLDLGQSLGKSAFIISHFWVSSRKSSDWEQNMCLGFDKAFVDSTGRTSGSIELLDFKVRTSIQWPVVKDAHNQTPLIQASLGFDQLCVKAGFDYQPFLIAHIKSFEFLMYNVRDTERSARDRLVGTLDAQQLQVYLTTASASQAIALYQAFQKLIQEKQSAYESSLRDIEKYLRRKSSVVPFALRPTTPRLQSRADVDVPTASLKLQTDVVVTLKSVNIGAFPSTFFDPQIFKLEALDASARFAVVSENERIHSTLGLILGQLRVALSTVSRPNVPKTLGDVKVREVVDAATGSRGGTILKVPKLIATMQTWQSPGSTAIDYVFRSSFQGKVDVGWNYSRISYIRGMYNSHERALAQRLGKEALQPAVQITGLEEDSDRHTESGGTGQEKITAVVNVPQSKYQYTAMQPPIIETPQLRDMGEATPPLEWIGLHRDRLPNLTHQIVIVTLLQLAGEVDEAYTQILGSS